MEGRDDRTGAPFNMALATLEGLHKTLMDIKILAAFSAKLTPTIIATKKNLVIQFYIQARTLMPEEKKQDGLDLINKIPTLTSNAHPTSKKVVYTNLDDVNQYLDGVMMLISDILQKEGYFMPPKKDPRVGWKQD